MTGANYYSNNTKNTTARNVVDGACVLAAVIAIAIACCTGCDKKDEKNDNKLPQVQQELLCARDSLEKALADKDSLVKVNTELCDSIGVLNDSLQHVTGRLYDCEKGKRCIVKKTPAKKKTVAKPVTKPVTETQPAKPIVVEKKPTVIEQEPAVVENAVVIESPQVVIKDGSDNNTVNINNGTIVIGNAEKSQPVDTTKCRVIVRARITQTITTRTR